MIAGRIRIWLLTHGYAALLLAAAVSLAAGFLASEIYRSAMEGDFRVALDNQVQREASSLELDTARGQAMGVAALLGLNEPLLKELVAGKRALDDPEALARLKTARHLLRADGIYVIDGKGLIVAHETDHERTTGRNVAFRPYWQEAIVGNENVYAAVGSKSGERGLYIAAAIRADRTTRSPIVGVIVVKLLADYLDFKLAGFGAKAALLSPQGVVFAASEKEWLFSLNGTPAPERIEAIGSLKQFGKNFDGGNDPKSLPFDPSAAVVAFARHRYATATAEVKWNDPAGEWSLVLLGDLATAMPLSHRLGLGAFAGLCLFVLLLATLRALHHAEGRRAAVAAAQQAAEKLAADARIKSRQAEIIARLGQEHDLPALAQSFLGQLAGFLPVHQASLYAVANTEGDLALAGAYGTVGAPAEISAGEGLIGQCALERQPLAFDLPVEGIWRIRSGLGNSAPRALLILPVLNGKQLFGILELASLEADFLAGRKIVEDLLPFLAMNLEILLAAGRTTSTGEMQK